MKIRRLLVPRLTLSVRLALAVAWGLPLSQAAGAEVLDSVNWTRMHACHSAMARVPLQSNLKLQNAARRLAGGADLHQALARVGYTGSQFSTLHISGAANDAQLSRMLAANYCRTLTEPKLREFGMARRGAELWMVLAAPVAMPSAADADSVGRHMLELVNAARAAGRRCGAKYFPPVGPLTLNR
ncbi:MAG: hypothetical protein ABJC66_18155, partial [Gammaproteobacteria bacterium]